MTLQAVGTKVHRLHNKVHGLTERLSHVRGDLCPEPMAP
jgi:hypothetical protein